MIRKGQIAKGIALVKRGRAVWEAGGGRQGRPTLKSGLAEGMAQHGDLAGALVLIVEAIAQNRETGLGRAELLCPDPPDQGPAARAEERSGGSGAHLPRFARLGTAAPGEILGTAHRGELCAADVRPGVGVRSPQFAGAGLRLVHRRL
jgi:hypothetical protein